jgi:hypothetical protein
LSNATLASSRIKSFFPAKILTTLDAGHPTTATTVEPTKEEVTMEMDGCISDRVVSSTKKLPSRSVKKRVVYFAKSDSELESDEDGDEAPKKRSFKKKANATNNGEFELGPNAAPALTHLLGTRSENAQSYTSRALAPVTNLSSRKKKSWPLQDQSSGKENWGNDVNMVSLQIPPSKMAMKPMVVSLSSEDNRTYITGAVVELTDKEK